ncbi:N-acetylglutamate synthase [Vibrio navarrensis]|uniref:DUF2850 domain-containing protein n=1 Tax=Vibrio navarrensis TaxID=29495 RepID=UPI0039B0EB3B|nr:N-acetylglutamate synthase [Vibrio navarrensis]MBE4593848.1 N-acetylglutamate synthase [Vibrio navarrensis]
MKDSKMPPTVKKNQTDLDSAMEMDAQKRKQRKIVERVLMGIALIGTVVVLFLYGDLISRAINPPLPKSLIYGKWVEQDVPHYDREVFELSAEGVTSNGSVVATSFEFDGKYFSYQTGGKERRFRILGQQQYVEMKLDSDDHYLPIFRLEGRQNLSLR